MDVETITEHCLALPGARADDAWSTAHPVVRVGFGTRGTALAYLGAHSVGVRLGADRREADAWLAEHDVAAAARPMAYVGRRGWTDVDLEVDDAVLRAAVHESYRLLVASLPADQQPEGWEQALAPEPTLEPKDEPEDEAGPEPEGEDEPASDGEPAEDEPGDDEPGDDEPEDDEPEDDEPEDDEPEDDEPEDDEPEDDEPGDDEPEDDEQPEALPDAEEDQPEEQPEEQLELDLEAPPPTEKPS